MNDLKSLEYKELESSILALGLEKYRTKQIFSWLHEKGVSSFDEMLNVPNRAKDLLLKENYISSCEIEYKFVSKIDGTVKYLFKLNDGEFVESVVMKYSYGYTICVSTQVGCKMGCTFCASTLAGFCRNLLPGEIESQIQVAQKDLGIRIGHVVLMGIGEPLDNFENVLKFFNNVNNENGLNISLRNITLSTSGVVPKIYELADKCLPITLTISLHAPFDDLRNSMMPVNKTWNIKNVFDACEYYFNKTSRRVSFEYVLIDGKNDTRECAEKLCELIGDNDFHINLIPLNHVEERDNKKSKDASIYSFCKILKSHGVNATIRRTLGSDINASCGQLRRKKAEK